MDTMQLTNKAIVALRPGEPFTTVLGEDGLIVLFDSPNISVPHTEIDAKIVELQADIAAYVDPDDELDSDIAASTTIEELKDALRGRGPKGAKVKGRK